MKTTHRFLALGLCGLLIWFLADTATVRQAVSEGLSLCARSVIPAMFPFLVVSGLLISLGLGPALAPSLNSFMARLFQLPGTAGAALLLGFAGGYPVGVSTAAALYRAGQLTAEETRRLLTFCNNANPAFFLNVLGAGVFQSPRTGLVLWLIHVLSALLTGILLGRSQHRPRQAAPPVLTPTRSFPLLWVDAVGAALRGILSVCAFVVIFYVLTRPLLGLPRSLSRVAVGCVELFSLTPLLPDSSAGFVLAAACSGWGGLSVLCQSAAMLEGTDLPLTSCLKGKAVQGLLSALLAGGWVFLTNT